MALDNEALFTSIDLITKLQKEIRKCFDYCLGCIMYIHTELKDHSFSKDPLQKENILKTTFLILKKNKMLVYCKVRSDILSRNDFAEHLSRIDFLIDGEKDFHNKWTFAKWKSHILYSHWLRKEKWVLFKKFNNLTQNYVI